MKEIRVHHRLVSCCCCNSTSSEVETIQMYSLTILEVRSLAIRVLARLIASRSLRQESISSPFLAFRGHLYSLAHGPNSSIFKANCIVLFSLSLILILLPPLLIGIFIITLGPPRISKIISSYQDP